MLYSLSPNLSFLALGEAVAPKWLLLHPTGAVAAAGISMEERNVCFIQVFAGYFMVGGTAATPPGLGSAPQAQAQHWPECIIETVKAYHQLQD